MNLAINVQNVYLNQKTQVLPKIIKEPVKKYKYIMLLDKNT